MLSLLCTQILFVTYFPYCCFRWWAPSKFDPVKSPMLFFKNGNPVIPPLPTDAGLDLVLKHMVLLQLSFSDLIIMDKESTLSNLARMIVLHKSC